MALTFLDNQKTRQPFEATAGGIVTETIKGLPKAGIQIAKDIGRGIARSIGSAGVTLGKALGGQEEVGVSDVRSSFGRELFKSVFGEQPIKAIEDRIAETELTIKKNEFARDIGADKFALPLAFGGVFGSTALDLTPFGGIEKNAVKAILKETTEAGAFKLAKNLGADNEVASKFALTLAGTKTQKEAVDALEALKGVMGVKLIRAGKQADIFPEDSTNKLVQAIKGAGTPLKELEKTFSAERGKRAGEIAGVFGARRGQAGYFQALSKLKGELAEPPKFEPISLERTDLDNLFNQIQGFERLSIYERISAANGLQKLLGGNLPQQSQLSLLEDIFGKELVGAVLEKRPLISKIGDMITDTINVPRALIASADMSAPLRQGIIFTLSKPVTSSGAFKEMFRQVFSQKNFDAWKEELPNHPLFKEMRDSGLYIADFKKTKGLSEKEERFMTNLAQKIPVWGAVIRAAERAYVGFLNKMRVDVFSQLTDQMKRDNIATPENLKSLANYVNNATGRGSLGKAEGAAQALNTIFFSPRLIAARFNMLNPVWYARQPQPIRKEAIKNMAKFIASGSTLLGLAAGITGGEVELDPRSTDFGKLRIGDTRWDVWGGFQQWVRVFAQLTTGERKSTVSGDIIELDGKQYPFTSRFDVAERFILGKLAPVPALSTELLQGQKIFGGDITLTQEIAENSIPLYLQDMMEVIDEFGPIGIFTTGVPAFFGIGVQTYKERKGSKGFTF